MGETAAALSSLAIESPAAIAAPARAGERARLFREGRRFAPIFHGFVRFVIASARERRLTRVHYLTREGEFFSAIHRLIVSVSEAPALPAAELLEVSRRSTFAASIDRVTPDTLMRMWSLYTTQSMRALLCSLNVEGTGFTSDLERQRLTLDEAVVHPWTDSRVAAFLADPSVADRLATACAEQRALLARYCRRRGFEPAGTLALADIGWRGTIQDNLALVFPAARLVGHYLGLQRYLNVQPANVEKIAFGPDENRQDLGAADILRFVTPYEMLTNSASGSVTRYLDSSGMVDAVREHHPGEDAVFRRYTEAFQDGVLSAVPELEHQFRRGGTNALGLRDDALRLWRKLAFDPPRVLGRAYAALHHDETFGLGGPVARQVTTPARLVFSAIVSRRSRAALERVLDATTWPAGALAAQRLRTPALVALRRRSLAPPPGRFDRLLARRRGRWRWRTVADDLRGVRVCCYGAGEFAAAVVRNRDLGRLDLLAFVDRDPDKIGRTIGGFAIVGPDRLAELRPDVILVTVFRNPAVVSSVDALVRAAGLRCDVRADVWE